MPSQMLTAADVLRGLPRSENEYRALALQRAAKWGRTLVDDRTALYPSVIGGVWRALCPNCNAGIAFHPDWQFAACLGRGCFHIFQVIVFPERWPAIEASLRRRPLKDQHWLSGPIRTMYQGAGRLQLPDETLEEIEEQTDVIVGRQGVR